MTTRRRPIRTAVRPGATLDRRQFLTRSGVLGSAVLLGPSFLAACGDDGKEGAGGGAATNTLSFSNWPGYIDAETVRLFEEETGIEFTYTEDFNDNNEFFAKIQPDLAAGRSLDVDLIGPSSWMTARLISLDFLDELPLEDAPNIANLVDDLKNPEWDPEGKFSVPWQSGITGIAYNIKSTGRELTSIEDLFDPAFKGKVGMLSEMRDTVGLVMLGTGNDPAEATFDSATEAFERIQNAKDDGHIRQFTGNDYMDDLAAGNFVACVGWSGDIAQLALDNPDLHFSVPEEGGMRWSDTMVMPKGSENVANVAKWIDYVFDPVNAARIVAFIGYNSPAKGVQEELRKDPETEAFADSPLMFPDAETLARTHIFATLDEEQETLFDERFAEIIGA